jgi:hypothetical protein
VAIERVLARVSFGSGRRRAFFYTALEPRRPRWAKNEMSERKKDESRRLYIGGRCISPWRGLGDCLSFAGWSHLEE